MKNIKSFLLGFFVCVLLFAGSSVIADEIESLIGKKVQTEFTVYLDGTQVERPGIVIDGSTYLPVRLMGNLLGFDVDFISGEVILTSKIVAETTQPVELDTNETLPTDEEVDIVGVADEEISVEEIDEKLSRLAVDRVVHIMMNGGMLKEHLEKNDLEPTTEEQEQLDIYESRLEQYDNEIQYWMDLKEQKLASAQ